MNAVPGKARDASLTGIQPNLYLRAPSESRSAGAVMANLILGGIAIASLLLCLLEIIQCVENPVYPDSDWLMREGEL